MVLYCMSVTVNVAKCMARGPARWMPPWAAANAALAAGAAELGAACTAFLGSGAVFITLAWCCSAHMSSDEAALASAGESRSGPGPQPGQQSFDIPGGNYSTG